jgi:hypothetical protein
MADFPEKSVKLAKEIAQKYKRRSKSKQDIAADLYSKRFFEIMYGFGESIRTGNCGCYLHEIVKESNCFAMAGVLYLIARESGLQPRMYWATSLKDIYEGQNLSNHGGAEHSFITVRTAKDEVYTIDPFTAVFGKTRFFPESNRMEIFEEGERRVTIRSYADMRELSQDEYIKRQEKNRTSEGGRLALSTTQSLKSSGGKSVYVTYNLETNELESSMHISSMKFAPEPYKRSYLTEAKVKVNEDGSFDFNKGTLSYNYATAAGWNEHVNLQEPLIFPVNAALPLWELWESIARAKGRKSSLARMCNEIKITPMIKTAGFTDRFSVEPGSLAAGIVDASNLTPALAAFYEEEGKAIQSYLGRCRDNEVSQRCLLRDAQYVKEQDKHKSPDNLWGLVYAKEDRIRFIKQAFEIYKNLTRAIFDSSIEKVKVHAGFKKGSKYHADRKYNADYETRAEQAEYFLNMAGTRTSQYPEMFDIVADRTIFFQGFDVEKMSLAELGRGLDENDLQRTVQERLFHHLVRTCVDKNRLFLTSYKHGLKKILKK